MPYVISLHIRPRYHGDDKKQEKLQVGENKWVRRIVGVKRIDKLRMGELREEVGVRETPRTTGVKRRTTITVTVN